MSDVTAVEQLVSKHNALKTEINSVLFSVIVYVQTLSLSDYQLTDLNDLNLDNIGKPISKQAGNMFCEQYPLNSLD